MLQKYMQPLVLFNLLPNYLFKLTINSKLAQHNIINLATFNQHFSNSKFHSRIFIDQMASLVLLVSELLRHENLDTLISSSFTSVAPSSSAAKRAAGVNAKCFPSKGKRYGQEQFQEDLPRVCVDLVWPQILVSCMFHFLFFRCKLSYCRHTV